MASSARKSHASRPLVQEMASVWKANAFAFTTILARTAATLSSSLNQWPKAFALAEANLITRAENVDVKRAGWDQIAFSMKTVWIVSVNYAKTDGTEPFVETRFRWAAMPDVTNTEFAWMELAIVHLAFKDATVISVSSKYIFSIRFSYWMSNLKPTLLFSFFRQLSK